MENPGFVQENSDSSFPMATGKKDDQSINSKKTLSELLEEEEICIVRTIAYERDSMNELHARTIAIDSQGRELIVDLDDLYAMVRKEWGLEAGTPEEL